MTQQEHEAVPTPVEKLRQLEEWIPNHNNDIIYDFGRFLADRLIDKSQHQPTLEGGVELVPMGFAMAATLAIADIESGVDGYTGQPIKGRLANLPEVIYPMLHTFVPKIARAIYPAEFADQVQAFYDQVNERVAEQPKPEKTKIDHATVIPGANPFEMLDRGENIPSKGILVSAHIMVGSHGVFQVYSYENLEAQLSHSRLHLNFGYDTNSRRIDFGYENPNYPGKTKQPYDRGDTTTYIPSGWGSLDAVDLHSGGRLIISKEADLIGNLSTSVDKDEYGLQADSFRREVVSYFEPGDYTGMANCIREIASKLIGLDIYSSIVIANEPWKLFDPEGYQKSVEEALKSL